MQGDRTLVVFFAAFVLGMMHAVAGMVQAFKAPRHIGARTLSALSWMWLCGPAFAAAARLGFDPPAGVDGLILATPSMLVALAASRVAHHTAAR
jgi:hypothetical protein